MPTTETLRRRREVELRMLTGLRPFEIARELEADTPLIATDQKRVRQEWGRLAARGAQAALAEELARLREIERHAWAEWFRSRDPVGKTTRTTKNVGTEDQQEQIAQGRAERLGEARYLIVVLYCHDRRARLLGLKADNRDSLPSLEDSRELDALVRELPTDQLEQINAAARVVEDLMRQAGLLPDDREEPAS